MCECVRELLIGARFRHPVGEGVCEKWSSQIKAG